MAQEVLTVSGVHASAERFSTLNKELLSSPFTVAP